MQCALAISNLKNNLLLCPYHTHGHPEGKGANAPIEFWGIILKFLSQCWHFVKIILLTLSSSGLFAQTGAFELLSLFNNHLTPRCNHRAKFQQLKTCPPPHPPPPLRIRKRFWTPMTIQPQKQSFAVPLQTIKINLLICPYITPKTNSRFALTIVSQGSLTAKKFGIYLKIIYLSPPYTCMHFVDWSISYYMHMLMWLYSPSLQFTGWSTAHSIDRV